jgi:hypothetical protein
MEGDQSEALDHTLKDNRAKIRPVMFMSKSLTDAESRYWPKELEVAYIVWTVRKIRHLIAKSKYGTVIYTDHSSAVDIVKQTTLISSNSDKLNLRLVRAGLYLSQYALDIRHRAGKDNTVPDALSRLTRLKHDSNSLSEDEDILEDAIDEYHCYSATMIEISDEFKNNIKKGYDLEAKRKLYQQETSDVTVYAQLHMKLRYDKGHTPLLLNTDDTAFLNLH